MKLLILKYEFNISNSLEHIEYDLLNNHKTNKYLVNHICDIFFPQILIQKGKTPKNAI